MVIQSCQHDKAHKHGKDRQGNMRFKCALCGKTFVNETARPIGDLRIGKNRAEMALRLMLEGMSVRSVQRMTGLCRQTLADLVLTVGENCQRLLSSKIRGVAVKDVQVDELWSFVGMKEKTRFERNRPLEYGDSWTFIGIERDTKLILAHHVGQRDSETCVEFLQQLGIATSGRFQLTTDGLRSYTLNVPFMLGTRVDFAQLIKNYATTQEVTRYSPAKITNIEKHPRFGNLT
jgi:transposase-like protein/IS1 family transposase